VDRSGRAAHRRRVTAAALDRLLALLIAALVTTGLVTLRMGAEGEAWVFAIHGILAAALAVTVAMKLGRSLPKAIRARRWGRVAFGLVLSAATIGALVAGFAWVASGRLLTVAAWTVLTIHAWIGLVLVPITIVHLLPRRWRLLRLPPPRPSRVPAPSRRMTRRQLLTAGAIGVASLAIFGGAQIADTLSGGVRRFTGSRWLPPGGLPPDTTFFGEAAPPIDAATWRLRVTDGAAVDVTYDLAAIRALGERDQSAILDCTSGWALETAWRGIPLRAVLAGSGVQPPSAPVIVRAATGWSTSLDPAELDDALLATGVGGSPLPLANGAPCRLVVPNRRGLDWVKWVTEIRVT
jgi:Oxidoreductase molybdopterin binding domain